MDKLNILRILTSMKRGIFFIPLLLTFVFCGDKKEEGKSQTKEEKPTQTAQVNVEFPEEWPQLKPDLAAKGEKLFLQKGCNACHTIGKGKLVGPDLKGLNQRVSFKWAAHMILNPDSMLKYDERAKQLLKEYGTPMTNQNVKPDEAVAILHYILRESQK